MLHGPNILPLNTIEILRSGRVLQARRVRVIVEPWKRIQKPLLTRTNVGKGNFHLVIFCTHSGTQLMSWLLLRRDFSFKQVAGFLLTFARKSSVTSITYVIVMTTTSNFRLILFFYSIKYFPEVDGWCYHHHTSVVNLKKGSAWLKNHHHHTQQFSSSCFSSSIYLTTISTTQRHHTMEMTLLPPPI